MTKGPRRACLAALTAVTFGLLLAGPASAGAWLMPKGEGQAISILSLYQSGGGFDDQGQPLPAARYRRAQFSTYIEYGLTQSFTVGIEPRYQKAKAGVGAFRDKSRGPGDLDIFVRRGLFAYGPWIGSVQALVKQPTYDRARSPAPGNGRREYELRLAIARNVELGWPGFFDSAIAYRRGTNGLADQLRAEATLGFRPGSRLMFLLKGYRSRSQGLGDGLPGSSYDLDKIEVSAVYRLTQSVSLELGAGSDVAGERVGLGHVLMSGVWVRF